MLLDGHKAGKKINCIEGKLAPREIEVAILLCCGFNERAISCILKIERHTVHAHIRNIYEKLGVTSRGRMVAIFLVSEIVNKEKMIDFLNQTGYCEQCNQISE